MKRVLVTGGAGFVGANLIRRLLTEGHRVAALVRPGGGRWRLDEVKDDVELLEGDLRDPDAAAGAVATAEADWIFHLAAHGGYSWQEDAARIVESNVLGTVNLVEAAVRRGFEALVHAGSSSEYGRKDHAPVEDEPLDPDSPYAVSKAAATLYCRHVARNRGLRLVTLRLYSVYGPLEEPERLVPTLIVRGLSGEVPPLVAPDTARDFVFVDDVCDAFLLAPTRGAEGGVYNIGSGTQTTVRELVEVARRTLEVDAEPEWGTMPARSWDTDVWVAEPSRARAELDWEAQVPLETGFRRTAEWLRDSSLLDAVYRG